MVKRQVPFQVAMEGDGVGVIKLHRNLSMWTDSAAEFKAALDDFILKGSSSVRIIFENCLGGNIYEGAVIIRHILESPIPVDGRTIGMCASMATAILAVCREREVDEMGVCLTHRAQQPEYGCYEVFAQTSSNLKKINDTVAAHYAKRLNMSIEDVHSKLMPFGKDIVWSADECVKLGLATKKYSSGVSAAIPLEVAAQSSLKAVAAFYEKQYETTTPTIQMDKQIIAAALGMTGEQDESKIAARVSALRAENATLTTANEALKTENDQLKAAQKTQAEAAATTMVEDAVKAGKVTAAEKDHFVTLAKANPDQVKAILDQRPAHTSIAGRLNQADANGVTPAEAKYGRKAGESDADFKDRLWKDPSEPVARMRTEDPELYKKLFISAGK